MIRSSYAGGDSVRLAVVVILLTVFSLSLGDAVIKEFSSGFPLWQIFVVRSLVALPILVAVVKVRWRSLSLLPASGGWAVLRSLMLVIMWVAYYAALPHVPLSVAAAVYYTLPLFITLFAALFLGETVGARGWLAVFMGFCGVLLILKPQGADFNVYALLPLISAVLYAIAMILTRSKCKHENPLVLALSLNATFVGVGAVAALGVWLWSPPIVERQENLFLLCQWISMGSHEWMVMGLLAAIIIVGSVGAAIAYQAGPSSVVSTFDFSYLAFAAIWGFLFFAERPDLSTLVGMGLIAAAGILAVRR